MLRASNGGGGRWGERGNTKWGPSDALARCARRPALRSWVDRRPWAPSRAVAALPASLEARGALPRSRCALAAAIRRRNLFFYGRDIREQDVGIAELPKVAHPHRIEDALQVIALVLDHA